MAENPCSQSYVANRFCNLNQKNMPFLKCLNTNEKLSVHSDEMKGEYLFHILRTIISCIISHHEKKITDTES